MKNINIIRTGGGRFTLYVNGIAAPTQFNYESTAIQTAINHLIVNPGDEIVIRQELAIRVSGSFAVKPGPEPDPIGGFVHVENGEFVRDGKPFRGSGTNAYYLPNYEVLDRGVVDRAFDTFQNAGVKIIRMWAFYDGPPQYDGDTSIQPRAREYNETGLAALDRVIAKGKERGMVFVLPLMNNWDQLGGVKQYCEWAWVEHSMSAFLSSAPAFNIFRDYISMLLNRVNTVTGIAYKDEPAIHSWQVMNEGRNPGGDPEVMRNWYVDIARHIKSIDKNHMVGTGEEGYDDASLGTWESSGRFQHVNYQRDKYSNTYVLRADVGSSFVVNVAIPEIDYGNFHWYPADWGWGSQVTAEMLTAQTAWLEDHVRIGKTRGKPVLLGEYGFPGWGDARVLQCYDALWTRAEQLNIPTLLWQLAADGVKCTEYGGNICHPGGRNDTVLFNAFKSHCAAMNNAS